MNSDTAWEGKTREELLQILYDMIATAPRDAVMNWMDTFFLPMLEEKEQRGGMQNSA